MNQVLIKPSLITAFLFVKLSLRGGTSLLRQTSQRSRRFRLLQIFGDVRRWVLDPASAFVSMPWDTPAIRETCPAAHAALELQPRSTVP